MKVFKATQGTMSLIGAVRNSPTVNEARISLAGLPQLQKIAPRSTIYTSRPRELAARVNAVLPDDSDTRARVRGRSGCGARRAHLLPHHECDRLPSDGAREHTGSVERRDCGARSRRPVSSRLHGRATAPATRAPCRCSGRAGTGQLRCDGHAVTPITAWDHVASDVADADLAECLPFGKLI